MVSSRANNVSESVTLQLNAKAVKLAESGRTIYNLAAGQLPNMPPDNFLVSIANELENIKSFQYSPVSGFPKLREKLIGQIEEKRGINYSSLPGDYDCIVSSGAKQSVSNMILTLVDKGDEVILLKPYWLSYTEMVKLADAKVVAIDSDNFIPKLDELEKSITKNTKIILLNSPNNPSGIYYPDDWMKGFAEIIKKHKQIFVISDEIYYDVIYRGDGPTLFYQYDNSLLERTIIIDGISKALACTGLRIGYSIASKEIIKAASRIQGHMSSGASSLIQNAMLRFDYSAVTSYLTPIKALIKKNAGILEELLIKSGLDSVIYPTTSAFYFLLDLSKTPLFKKFNKDSYSLADQSVPVCEDILEKLGVVIVPTPDFGAPNCVRISLVLPSDKFETAITKLVNYLG